MPSNRLSGVKRTLATMQHGSRELLFTCSTAALAFRASGSGEPPKVGKLTFVMLAGIQGRTGRVKCLLDSGATSCFISRAAVKKFGLREVDMAARGIVMPDGTEEETTAFCNVPLRVHGHDVSVACLVPNLSSHEIILGDTFLALTDANLSWRTQIAQFIIGNMRVV